jgi:AAA domain
VRRFEARGDADKYFLPLTYGVLNGIRGWHKKAPDKPRPLYRLNALSHSLVATTVVLCEGEQSADAAARILPDDFVCMTWMGGANAIHKSDFTVLSGFDVILWPDADDVGREAMARIVKLLPKATILDTSGLPDGFDAADLEQDDCGDPLAWLERRLPREQPQPEPPPDDTEQKRRFPLVPFADIQVNRSAAYLVRHIIPREGLVVVWGPPGCGKSFWVLDLVMHIALERSYRKYRVKQGDAVYVACEGERGLNNRVVAWRRHNKVDSALFWLVTTHLDLAAEYQQLIQEIRDQIGQTKPSVITLDTLNRSLNGSESSDEDMAAYIRAADFVREDFNCVVIVIHHCGLDATRPRGHTSLKGASDAQIAVSNTNDTVVATVERMKDGVSGTVVASTLKVVDLGHDEDGEEITSCAIEPADAPEPEPAGTRPSPNDSIALRCLSRAMTAHGIMTPVGNGLPERVAVHVEEWRKVFYLEGMPGESQDTRKRAFSRCRTSLIDKEAVFACGDMVWPA